MDGGESSKINSSTRVSPFCPFILLALHNLKAAPIMLSDELLTKYRQRMNAVKRQRNCGGEVSGGKK
jgi:hypothetical protein